MFDKSVVFYTSPQVSSQDTWASIQSGDIIAYGGGSIFYIESVSIKDNECMTFLVCCIVPGENDIRQQFGNLGMLCVSVTACLPFDMIVTRK